METIQNAPSCVRQVKVNVKGTSESPTKINLRSGKFKLVIDEPEAMGGTNEGPSPVQVLLMALAGCLSVTGHYIARERGMPLQKMKIAINGDMNPCLFMGCSDEERAGFQKIKVLITPKFSEPVDEETVNAWIAETERRCPVTDNIKTGTAIEVKMA